MLTPQGIDRQSLFRSLEIASRPSVIAAVSGGSDSTALLLLLKDHLASFAPATRLVAVTVDHAIRPEAAAEAAAVARRCAELGIAHRIVTWYGDKPATGVLAAAREARHMLLAQAAVAESTDLVLTGHTADDQAETVMMRLARERGRGLAGVATATLFEGRVWFARPLLACRRKALRDYLQGRGVDWIDDPTNVDDHYERPRVRKGLETGDVEEALQIASDAARARVTLGEAAALLIDNHAHRVADGILCVEPAFFQTGRRDAAIYGLRILLAVAGGTEHLPDLNRVTALHDKLLAGGSMRSVLSRTLIDHRKDALFLLREGRGLPQPPALAEGSVWDGRYRLARSAIPRSDNPNGNPSNMLQAPKSLVRLAASTLLSLPEDWRAVPTIGPWTRYLPSFDIAPARAAARLVGAAEIPDPPFRRHIAHDA